MNNDTVLTSVCPIFNFQISEVLRGHVSTEEANKYFENLRAQFTNGIELYDNIKIRRINADDFKQIEESQLGYLLKQESTPISAQTFVIEFKVKLSALVEEERIVNETILAMRLYKTGNVYANVVWHKGNTLSTYLPVIRPSSSFPFVYWGSNSYSIELSEIEKIGSILSKIKKLNLQSNNSFRLACERFSRSFEDKRNDDRIIDFAIAFESLFHRAYDRDSTEPPRPAGQFFGLGCSMLLGKNEDERKEIFEFVSKLFKLRNSIVHSLPLKEPVVVND